MEHKNKLHTCCFFGHRSITETEELKQNLRRVVEMLILEKDIYTFLFGSKSKFDALCHRVVTELKEKYPHIQRVYVRAEFPYIDDRYKQYLLQSYEDTYYPKSMRKAGKAAYVERNCEMIDNSQFCVVYYDETYAPPKRKYSRGALTDYQPKSGTRLAYDYAVKKGAEIINILSH